MIDPAGEASHTNTVPKRSVIGIGSGSNYTLYDPASDHIEFPTVADDRERRSTDLVNCQDGK